MSLFSQDFNFHGLAGIRVITEDPAAAGFYEQEYRHQRVLELPASLPRVIVRFQRSYRLGRAGYTHHAHKIAARWDYRLSIAPQEITIEAHGNRTAIPMVHHMLVHHSLRYLVSFQGNILLHAGAVARDGKSLIFTGKGGIGKTTTTALVLSVGGPDWGIQADDYVFLDADGASRSYITRAHLYRSLLAWVPEISDKLAPMERVKLQAFGLLREKSGERVKWPLRFPLDRLWAGHNLVDEARPAGLVLLQRGDVSEPALEKVIADAATLNDLLDMNEHEGGHFLALLEKSGAVPDVERLRSEWRQREHAALERFLTCVPIYRLTLPQRVATSQVDGKKLVERLSMLIDLAAEAE